VAGIVAAKAADIMAAKAAAIMEAKVAVVQFRLGRAMQRVGFISSETQKPGRSGERGKR
jgi:hypothetical protein